MHPGRSRDPEPGEWQAGEYGRPALKTRITEKPPTTPKKRPGIVIKNGKAYDKFLDKEVVQLPESKDFQVVYKESGEPAALPYNIWRIDFNTYQGWTMAKAKKWLKDHSEYDKVIGREPYQDSGYVIQILKKAPRNYDREKQFTISGSYSNIKENKGIEMWSGMWELPYWKKEGLDPPASLITDKEPGVMVDLETGITVDRFLHKPLIRDGNTSQILYRTVERTYRREKNTPAAVPGNARRIDFEKGKGWTISKVKKWLKDNEWNGVISELASGENPYESGPYIIILLDHPMFEFSGESDVSDLKKGIMVWVGLWDNKRLHPGR